MNQLDIPRSEIQVDTKLDTLIGKRHRNKSWKDLLSSISNGQHIYAPLERPGWATALIASSTVIAFITVHLETNSGGLATLASLFTWFITSTVTTPLKNEFPKNYRTVKGLIRITGSLNNETWSRDSVYSRIRMLVAAQLGIDEDAILPDLHFINDLGMG